MNQIQPADYRVSCIQYIYFIAVYTACLYLWGEFLGGPFLGFILGFKFKNGIRKILRMP